jgi:hypothetical protein
MLFTNRCLTLERATQSLALGAKIFSLQLKVVLKRLLLGASYAISRILCIVLGCASPTDWL